MYEKFVCRILLFILCAGLLSAQAETTVYEASVGGRHGWLTVPKGPARALFFTHRNMTEEALLRHPEFVKACARLSIACLYVFPSSVVGHARNIMPSERGRYEITDVNKRFFDECKLQVQVLDSKCIWFDTNSIDNLLKASEYFKKQNNIR